MVQEVEIPPFETWFGGGLAHWLLVAGSLAVAALLIGWLVSAMRYGPWVACTSVGRVLWDGLLDLVRISAGRAAALAWLAVKESIRRRVVVVFAVFILVLLFAGWFLDPGSTNPARLYLDFVLTATSYLVLLLALFLSALSLPADFKNRTIYTVVTKPVRPSEIVLGRILGFTAIGTALLVVMGLASYVFVVRGLSHTHELVLADLAAENSASTAAAGQQQPISWKGRTSRVQQHRHEVYIDASGQARVEMENGHWHDLTLDTRLLAQQQAAKRSVPTGPPQGLLVARVPIYGKLRFHDRVGNDAEKGINVGDEWVYRSYIAGGTLAAAIWAFDGISQESFPEGLPVEMNITVFRSYKGEIEKGIPASLSVRNPKSGAQVEVKIFPAKEYVTDTQFIPRTLQTPDGRPLDLFRDLVADGKLEIWLRCLAPAQYFGAAQPDLYLRARDVSFTGNFAKGYLGIWLQMVLLIGFGVMFSTFLSGPVAMIATVGALVGGLVSPFMAQLAAGKVLGGGPLEALVRLVTQQNLITELEPGLRTTVTKTLDLVLERGVGVFGTILPEFGQFSYADYVAYGFDIPWNVVLIGCTTTLGCLLPVFVAGYFFLKTREVAR